MHPRNTLFDSQRPPPTIRNTLYYLGGFIMDVQITLRKIGNSIGFAVPAAFLNGAGLKEGDVFSMCTSADGTITLKPTARKYTLKELLAECDPKAPAPKDMADWDAAPAVGQELL